MRVPIRMRLGTWQDDFSAWYAQHPVPASESGMAQWRAELAAWYAQHPAPPEGVPQQLQDQWRSWRASRVAREMYPGNDSTSALQRSAAELTMASGFVGPNPDDPNIRDLVASIARARVPGYGPRTGQPAGPGEAGAGFEMSTAGGEPGGGPGSGVAAYLPAWLAPTVVQYPWLPWALGGLVVLWVLRR